MAMLQKTLKNLRTQHGMTQEELAIQLHVVRQTVSKWEKGMSVPDGDTLLAIGQLFEVPVSQLLKEDVCFSERMESTEILSKQLARVNEQLAKKLARERFIVRSFAVIGLVVLMFLALAPFLFKLETYLFFASQDIAVIGGADGPTAIYLTGASPNFVGIALYIGAVCLCLYGIYATRRK